MRLWFIFVLLGLWPYSLFAGFIGSSEQSANKAHLAFAYQGQVTTVAQARNVAVDEYVMLTGYVVSHIRADYYIFKDQTGEVVVEIEPPIWRNQDVGTHTPIRIIAEVDRDAAEQRYLWVESLTLFEP